MKVMDFQGLLAFLPLGKTKVKTLLPEIPHFQLGSGSKLLFREDEVLRWLEGYRKRPARSIDDIFEEADRMIKRSRRGKSK